MERGNEANMKIFHRLCCRLGWHTFNETIILFKDAPKPTLSGYELRICKHCKMGWVFLCK